MSSWPSWTSLTMLLMLRLFIGKWVRIWAPAASVDGTSRQRAHALNQYGGGCQCLLMPSQYAPSHSLQSPHYGHTACATGQVSQELGGKQCCSHVAALFCHVRQDLRKVPHLYTVRERAVFQTCIIIHGATAGLRLSARSSALLDHRCTHPQRAMKDPFPPAGCTVDHLG
jgi:hypothetical protein